MGEDWTEHLDRELARLHDRPVTEYVLPGRTALRRRRAALAAASLVAVVAAGGGVALAAENLGPGRASTDPDVATDSSQRSERGSEEDDTRRPGGEPTLRPEEFLGEPIGFTDDGRLVLAEGVREIRRVRNPMGYPREVARSVALEVEQDGDRQFTLGVVQGGGYSVSSSAAVGELEDWLPGQVAAQRVLDRANGVTGGDDGPGAPGGPDRTDPAGWLRTDGSGVLVPGRPGVTVLDQRSGVDLGDDFAAPADTSVAELRVDGDRIFVAVRAVGDELEVIPGGGGHDDLDAFERHAREQYAGGGGLL